MRPGDGQDMNAISTLIDPMLVGFLAVVMLHVARYSMIRRTGYAFLLPVLAVGTVLMYVVDVGLTELGQVLDWDRGSWRFRLGSTVFWSTTLALLIPLVVNSVIGRQRSARLAAKWRGGLTECLMQDCIDSRSLVELTLKTGKSYVGLVLESGISTHSESDVSIVPVFSGHRDDEQQLQLTTSYLDVILETEDDLLYKLELVLSKSQLASARRFDIDIFAESFGRPLPESNKN